MSAARDKLRERIIEINNTCADITHDEQRDCNNCKYSIACTYLLAFDEWQHMHTARKAGDEDLERLVDSVMKSMTIEDYEDLLEDDI